MMKRRYYRLGITASFVLLIAAAASLLAPWNHWLYALQDKPEIKGFIVPLSLPDTPLVSHQWESVSWAELRQQPLFLTVGFTSCGYTCPANMARLTSLKQQLPYPAQYALLTVDPVHDTPERLATFLQFFDPTLIGLRVEKYSDLGPVLSAIKTAVHHTGKRIHHEDAVYLFHPKLSGLVIYKKIDIPYMLEDFSKLQQWNSDA